MRRFHLAMLALLAASAPLAGQARKSGEISDLLMRINGPVVVAAGDTVNTVVVVNHDATIRGVVREQLVVIGGTAHISGTVSDNVVLFNGRLVLDSTARLERDIALYRSSIVRAPGAFVAGGVREYTGRWPSAASGLAFAVGVTLVMLVAGVLFAAVAAPSLVGAGEQFVRAPGRTVLAAIVVWAGLPLAAVLLFGTVIGIPLAIAVMMFLLPALGFLGYLVSAQLLGSHIAPSGAGASAHPYRAVLVGVLVLQLASMIPLVGPLALFAACTLGAGALVARAWTRWRGMPLAQPVPAVAV